MNGPRRSDAEDLRAAASLLVTATVQVTHVVESMHRVIASGPALLGSPLSLPVRWAIAPAYGAVRGTARVAGAAVDSVLRQLAPHLPSRLPGAQRLALQASLNGVLGDALEEAGNGLALEMSLCRAGVPLLLEREALRRAFPHARRRLVVLVHGSSMTDTQWRREGHDHGAMLEETGEWDALYLRYNSGRHISTNGRELAALLERLVQAWPEPVVELALVGHSMGGLVARSACNLGEVESLRWRTRLTRLVCLAAPHHGAVLERAGSWLHFLLGVSPYVRPLGTLARMRSSGVTDLRYGNVRDEDWAGVDRFAERRDVRTRLPLPSGVLCYAVAATKSPSGAEKLKGDGLVSVASALGLHDREHLSLGFPEANRFVAHGNNHLGVLSSPEVASKLRDWFTDN